jgi:hypothetical protein
MKTNAELLELRTIPTADLKILAEFCASRQANQFFEDNFVILSRILLAQHECREMSEYSQQDLAETVATFADLLDRNQSLPAEHPTRTFLRFNLTAAHGELQKRARKEAVRVVKTN